VSMVSVIEKELLINVLIETAHAAYSLIEQVRRARARRTPRAPAPTVATNGRERAANAPRPRPPRPRATRRGPPLTSSAGNPRPTHTACTCLRPRLLPSLSRRHNPLPHARARTHARSRRRADAEGCLHPAQGEGPLGGRGARRGAGRLPIQHEPGTMAAAGRLSG
jgi:hypothetical protein